MREYAKVGPQFWFGETGKKLKKQGTEAVIVALYLVTCQHANMLGLYYVSPTYIAVDTGLGLEGASKGLAGACEAGFCRYDEGSEVVWVVEMAAYQIGDSLEARDNRCKGVQREYDSLPTNPFLWPFYERYGACFHMTAGRGKPAGKTTPSKAPRKPLRSQEQEQEQEKEQEQEQDKAPVALSVADLVGESVDEQAASEWFRVRKKKRAVPLSPLAWSGFKAEAKKAGWTLDDAVRKCAQRNWVSFEADWVKAQGPPANKQIAVETENQRIARQWAGTA